MWRWKEGWYVVGYDKRIRHGGGDWYLQAPLFLLPFLTVVSAVLSPRGGRRLWL